MRRITGMSQRTVLTIEITALCLTIAGMAALILFGVIALLVTMIHVIIDIL
jgi:hypothetical protein